MDLRGSTGRSGDGRFRTARRCAAIVLAAGIALSAAPVAASDAPPEEGMGLSGGTLIAVLPVQNRSDADGPLTEIRETLARKLGFLGFTVLETEVLEAFMRRYRMRHVGGINGKLAVALREETGADAILITSLDLYREANPPKAAVTSRLVSSGAEPRILWMDSASESGDGSPGALGLGLIHDIDVILERVSERLAESAVLRSEMPEAGEGDARKRRKKAPRRFRPDVAFGSPGAAVLGEPGARIAVLPLANESLTAYAGAIVTDQLIRRLVDLGLNVVEPGVVRHTLLETRQIQPKGPSIPQVELLYAALNVNRVLFGEVSEFTEAGAGTLNPVVDFSVRAVDTGSRQVIWSSISHTRGSDGVFFFDVGRIPTAHELTARMADALVATFLRSAPDRNAGHMSLDATRHARGAHAGNPTTTHIPAGY